MGLDFEFVNGFGRRPSSACVTPTPVLHCSHGMTTCNLGLNRVAYVVLSPQEFSYPSPHGAASPARGCAVTVLHGYENRPGLSSISQRDCRWPPVRGPRGVAWLKVWALDFASSVNDSRLR